MGDTTHMDRYHKYDLDDETEGREHDGFTLTWGHCEDEYTPDDARIIVISGPSEARYTCPRYGHGTDGPLPVFNDE